jgi:hypothetical protein
MVGKTMLIKYRSIRLCADDACSAPLRDLPQSHESHPSALAPNRVESRPIGGECNRSGFVRMQVIATLNNSFHSRLESLTQLSQSDDERAANRFCAFTNASPCTGRLLNGQKSRFYLGEVMR